ncbi:hypothetical protein Tco_0083811 [Tanacetum coccineum]
MDMEDPLKVTQSLAADFNKFVDSLNPDVQPSGASDKANSSSSFASVLQAMKKKTVKLSELRNDEVVEGAKVTIPLVAVEEVKLRHVPIVAYSEIGLSLIMTQIGRPIMLDSYTSNMYLRSWGRKESARALIEISLKYDFMESIVIAILLSDGKGHTLATVNIEYEWKPPRCSLCSTFDHNDDMCPKCPKETTMKVVVENDGFIEVKRKKNKSKQPRQVDGIRITKPSLNLHYKRVEKGESSKFQQPANTKNIYVPFGEKVTNEASSSDETNSSEEAWNNAKRVLEVINESDSEDVDQEIIMEERSGVSSFGPAVTEGASTPGGKSHVLSSKLDRLCTNVFRHWSWTSNGALCLKAHYDQVMHARLWLKADKKELFCSFIYAHNRPWCMLGDFNAALNLEDMLSGSSNIDISMREFKDCVEDIEMMDVHRSGLMFTWNQKPKGSDGVLKKIDRVMANLEFNDVFAGSYAVFQPYRISDHAPYVSRFCMFRVVKKLKNLKKPLRKLLFSQGNLNENVKSLRLKLDRVQKDLDADPTNVILCEEEAAYVQAFNNALLMLDVDIAADMVWPVTDLEVKETMFSMRNDKSLGPDGFTAAFFKEAWDIVASDVINAVKEFFVNGTLLKELNHTIIALIPKVSSPTHINDYRPISCCNMLFKCISKIISNRIKGSLKVLVSSNQSAFMLGRRISDNILLTQELMHNYHLDRGLREMLFKKYGVVPLLFLSVKINVVLSWLRSKGSWYSVHFTFHCYCSEMDLINLCFADDLFLFAHGDVDSARVIMEALDEFKLASEGRLPVKYLGVPLVSSRLLYRGCKELIEKVHNRIKDWRTNLFGCPAMEEDLNLVQSVIGSMHVYWASVFILPTRMLLKIEQLMRGFLWCQGTMRKGKSKVTWEVVCLPKHEGGLGFTRAGFDLNTKLSEVIIDNVWRWPTDWSSKYPNIISLPIPMLQPNDHDCLEWRDDTAIPRHAFLMWLVIKGKLNTQDKMVGWNTSLICPLCESQPDSHTHLFFECSFSDQVWSRMKVLAGLSTASSSISDVVDQIVPISKRRQVRCIIAKLVIAACAYFIWQERNWRLFRLQKRTVAQVIECIKSSVRLKLLSCSFKMSKTAKDMLTLWQLPETIICTSR